MQIASSETRLVVDANRRVDAAVRTDADRAAGVGPLSPFDALAEIHGLDRLTRWSAEIDAEHAQVIEQLQVRRLAVGSNSPVGMDPLRAEIIGKRLAFDEQRIDGDLIADR